MKKISYRERRSLSIATALLFFIGGILGYMDKNMVVYMLCGAVWMFFVFLSMHYKNRSIAIENDKTGGKQ